VLHPEGCGGPKAFLPPRRFSDCKINSFFYYRQHFGGFFENVPFFANMQALKSPDSIRPSGFLYFDFALLQIVNNLAASKTTGKTARLTFLMVAFFLG